MASLAPRGELRGNLVSTGGVRILYLREGILGKFLLPLKATPLGMEAMANRRKIWTSEPGRTFEKTTVTACCNEEHRR
jgi:hypothetical protein